MRDEIFANNPVLRDAATVLVCALLIGFGLFCLLNPQKAQEKYAQSFKMDSKLDWGDPSTYLRTPIPLILFRVIGLFMFFVGMFVLCGVLFGPIF